MTRPELSLDVEQHGSLMLMRAAGELDFATAPQFQEALDAVLAGDTVTLALDLSQLLFIDSSGTRLLLFAQRAFQQRGGGAYLVSVSESVMRVLSMLHLTQFVTICHLTDLLPFPPTSGGRAAIEAPLTERTRGMSQ